MYEKKPALTSMIQGRTVGWFEVVQVDDNELWNDMTWMEDTQESVVCSMLDSMCWNHKNIVT